MSNTDMGDEGRRYSLARLRGTDLLRANPALAPALLATGAFVALAASEAGFYPGTWYAGALFLLGLLAVSLLALGPPRHVPRAVVGALVLLAAYTVWTYVSIGWASQQGQAWHGANRTAMYLVVFALFALWRFDARGATAVLGLLGLGIAGVGLVELLKIDAASDPAGFFVDVRLAEPAGYMNANVALWTLGLLPCIFLASRREVPALLRGLALGGAGVLAGLALLGQSRGWALALPLALVFFLVVCPGRVRLLAATVAVAVAAVAIQAPVVAVHDDYTEARLGALVSEATSAILIAAAVLLVAGVLAALLDRRLRPGPAVERRIGWATGVLVLIALVAGAAAFAAREGSPTGEVADAWRDFKHGGQGPQAGGSRFAGQGGTNRYDFWRVAWDAFGDQPVRGIGVENFQEEYLEKGDSDEQPRYAHSLELGVMSQTGLIGALLLFGGLAAALAGALRSRAGPRPERALAAALAALFVYWLLHASVDWFWEFPALTGVAFGALGLACALAPRVEAVAPAPERAPRHRWAVVVLAGIPGTLLALSLSLPWLAELETDRAAQSWQNSSEVAFDRLERAEDLNPLSARAPLTAATIALRLDRVPLARRKFEEALEREPRNVYALLELGALAAGSGDRATARRLLARARALSPRDDQIAQAFRQVRRGRKVDLERLNQAILERAQGRGSREQ